MRGYWLLILIVANELKDHPFRPGSEFETTPAMPQFFDTTRWLVGDLCFSLDDIEHGVLRCNRGSPAKHNPQFAVTDTRWPLVLPEADFDPRIHFALNCGAKG